MNIARIQNNIRLDTGDPFIVIYGNVNDAFFDINLVSHNIEYMLKEFFKEEGYQRVVFFDPAKKLYALDEESRQQLKPRQEQDIPQGPLGGSGTLKRKSQPKAASPLSIDSRYKMSDLSALSIMDWMFKDSSVSTAIVFTHADMLNHFSPLLELQSRMRDWSTNYEQIRGAKRNIAVFVFQCMKSEDVKDFVDEHQFTVLRNFLFSRSDKRYNFFYIGGPDTEEFINMLRDLRVKHDVDVDVNEQEKISGWLSANVLNLREWYLKIKKAEKFNAQSVNKALQEENKEEFQNEPADERLKKLVGLSGVKEKIDETKQVAKKYGKKAVGTLHMAFLGNPGTGKTTIARLVSEIYRDVGILRRGHTVIANRGTLVGKYEGHTAPTVNTIVDQALDGVLFIDEAYSLNRKDDPFGEEAITTLLERMENDRERLCVILAGYPEETKKMILMNPGLNSRFQNQIQFENYTADEMVEIFIRITENKKSTNPQLPSVSSELTLLLTTLFERMIEENAAEKHWSNGREVRNLYEKMLRVSAARKKRPRNRKVINELLPEDIPDEYEKYVL